MFSSQFFFSGRSEEKQGKKRFVRILFFLILLGLFYSGALNSKAQTTLSEAPRAQAVLSGAPVSSRAVNSSESSRSVINNSGSNTPAVSVNGVAAPSALPTLPANPVPPVNLNSMSNTGSVPSGSVKGESSSVSPLPPDRPNQIPAALPSSNKAEKKQGESKVASGLPSDPQIKDLLDKTEYLTSEKGVIDSLKVFLVLTVLSLVPAIFMMTTSFIRIVTVLSILRQALGTGQIPPNQVVTALSVFLTFLIMMPAWTEVYEKSLVPYSHQEITASEAFDRGQLPIRTFLWKQIEKTGNTDMIWTFMKYAPDAKAPQYYEEIPWRVLLPAFMLSELKTAFLIGFQIFLPFVIIDLIVSAVMVSMGMMMLPPTVVSLPFKLLLFVLMDGWTLTAKMLLESFTWFGTGG